MKPPPPPAADHATAKAPVLIAGITSAIGRALAEVWALRGHPLILTARQPADAASTAADLTLRFGVPTTTLAYDAEPPGLAGTAGWQAAFHQAHAAVSPNDGATPATPVLHGVVVAFGLFGRTLEVTQDPTLHARMQRINAHAVDELLAALLPRVAPTGFAAVVSSVAGDRPRPSLQSYAESKQTLNTLLARHRAGQTGGPARGPTITIIKPGPVETPMTWGIVPPGKGAPPARIARDAAAAIDARRSAVYTPFHWRYVMGILRLVPGPIYRRLPI